MASDDSQTVTATTSEKPVENKEAKLMEKDVVLLETDDVVKGEPVSDSNLVAAKKEQIDQTPTGEPEKEVPVVVKAEETREKVEDGEQVEIKESTPILVKEGVEEVKVGPVDAEKAEEKGKDEKGEEEEEEKVAEQVELKEPTLVEEVKIETVDAETTEEKQTLEGVAEENNKDKEEEVKGVVVSEPTHEAIGNQVEPALVQSIRDVSAEDKTEDVVEVLEVEPKPEASEKVETQLEKAEELAPEVEVVKAEETPETPITENLIVETKDSGNRESDSALCPEEILPTSQDSDTAPKKETEVEASSPVDVIEKAITEETRVVDEPSKDEDVKTSETVPTLCPEKETGGDVSSPADVTEKSITEEKHVVEEPASKDEQEKVSEAKEVVTEPVKEDENIKTDTTEGKIEETLKEAEKETKQEEAVTEVVETTPTVEDSNEVTTTTAKEVATKQKQSNSIMSKVKQSFVKAKKAIIGKSPSSKTISTEEPKGEIKV